MDSKYQTLPSGMKFPEETKTENDTGMIVVICTCGTCGTCHIEYQSIVDMSDCSPANCIKRAINVMTIAI